MDAAGIHAKIHAGRGKVAAKLGLEHALYRPIDAGDPLANQVATIKAVFSAADGTYKSPNKPGKNIWYGDFDGQITQAGDYLEGAGKVYFIAAQQHLLPIVCVECNAAIVVSRAPETSAAVGAVGYSGMCDADSSNVLGTDSAGWPCSILLGGSSHQATGLPSSVKNAGWHIFLPPSVPITLKAGDILTSEIGQRFAVDGAELSATGWRLEAHEAHV